MKLGTGWMLTSLLAAWLSVGCGGGKSGGAAPVDPPPPPPSANSVVPGAITTPYPTLENLAVEWAYSGDANGNSSVDVRYRPTGGGTWNPALPLRRVPEGSNEGFSWTRRHSGSVFGLQPGTAYEIELTLKDPDGGGETRVVTVSTRAIPVPASGAPVKAATPATLANVLSGAQPGDIIELGAGTYAGFTVGRSGSAGLPLVVRGTAGALVQGEIGIFGQQHVHLDRLSVQGRIRFNGSNHMAITRCAVQAAAGQGGDGIVTYLRAENAYIADNTITGLTTWAESSLGVNGDNLGEGILVTGPGHVIMNNRVTGMRDGISFLEDGEAKDQFCIDVLNNDISGTADDAIEADFAMHNCRIMRNRITNTFIGLSSQPGLGGPTYFIRNVLYNVAHVGFKLYRGSAGDVLFHNTVVKNGDAFGEYAGRTITHALLRNNLFLGGPGGTYNGYSSGSGRVAQAADMDLATLDADYDAYGSTTGTFTGRFGSFTFDSLASLQAGAMEKHARQGSLGDFAATVAFPSAPMTAYAPVDLRLRPGSPLLDAAAFLPNVNSGHQGAGPDPGAYEQGATLPAYGPR